MSNSNVSTGVNPREERGRVIAASTQIRRTATGWTVPSQSSAGRYVVSLDGECFRCTCSDHTIRRARCKHIIAVEITISQEVTAQTDGERTTVTITETRTKRVTYRQPSWPAYNKAQTEEKATFLTLLYDLCRGVPQPVQTMGRPRLPMADMVFAAAFKVYSTFSGRRFMSDLHDAHAKGYLSCVPHYNSIFTYLEGPAMTPVLRDLITVSSLPLRAIEQNFAIDSSGFSTSRFVQ